MMEQIRQELQTFGETTSIKGVGRALKSHRRVVRIFWIVALFTCFSILLFQVITLVISYCNYGVKNNFLWVPSQPNFPDVTICNFLLLADEKQFYELYGKFLQKIKIIKDQAPDELKKNNEFWNVIKLLSTFNVNIPLLEDLENQPNVNDLIVASYFYDWDLFERKNCDKVLSWNKPLQLCKTLKPNTNAAAITAVIYINELMPKLIHSYFNWIKVNSGTGIKIMIHPRGTKPNIGVEVNVPPGTSVSIDVKQNNITRLPYPYGNCSDRQRIFMEEENSPLYDRPTCISLCRQRQYIKACGCLDEYEIVTLAELRMGNFTFCLNITRHLEDSQMYTEHGIVTENFWRIINCSESFVPSDDNCDCPIPCSETQYEISSSSSNWPNIHYQLAFYDAYIRNDDRYSEKFAAYEKIWNNSDDQSDAETIEELQKLKLIEQNFLQVTVKMSENLVQLVRDIPAVSWDTLASNLGGSLNLWLGVSIMTAAEIIELVYSLVKIALSRKESGNQNTHL